MSDPDDLPGISDVDLTMICLKAIKDGCTFGHIVVRIRAATGCGARDGLRLTLIGLMYALATGCRAAGVLRTNWLLRHIDYMNKLVKTHRPVFDVYKSVRIEQK